MDNKQLIPIGQVEHGCGCKSCGDIFAEPEKTEQYTGKRFNTEQKRELGILSFSALLFILGMIFEEKIMAVSGVWGVRAAYTLPYLLCGIPVFIQALQTWKRRELINEFTLMCGATVAAIFINHMAEAVGVMLFYRIGEFLQDMAISSSRGSIRALLASKPTTANVLVNGNVTAKAVEEVTPGAVIVVRPGEKIPLDGMVITGSSTIDQSPLTGESRPVTAKNGTLVHGGCINIDGMLEIRVTNRFADTHIASILEMVENAVARKSPTERMITRLSRYYMPAVVIAAAFVAILPPLLSDASWQDWLHRALVLLVISCPCALLISIPLGYFAGIGKASRQGILVKGGNVLDAILQTKTVMFDKTGTLTAGSFTVTDLIPSSGTTPEALLAAAAIAECESNHPIARSIMEQTKNFTRPKGLNSKEIAGKGILAETEEGIFLAGNETLMSDYGIDVPQPSGHGSIVHIAQNNHYLGCIIISDTIKENAVQTIAELKAMQIKTAILSGDRKESVAWVASETGVDDYRAELLPGDKVAAMQEISNQELVTFVGDGINDAPILATAKVGIAMGGIGSEAAIEVADAVILNDSPANVAELYRIAAKVRKVVWQNIIMALGIKTLFMGLGIAALSGLWEAVFADVGVALLAVLNSVRAMKK